MISLSWMLQFDLKIDPFNKNVSIFLYKKEQQLHFKSRVKKGIKGRRIIKDIKKRFLISLILSKTSFALKDGLWYFNKNCSSHYTKSMECRHEPKFFIPTQIIGSLAFLQNQLIKKFSFLQN